VVVVALCRSFVVVVVRFYVGSRSRSLELRFAEIVSDLLVVSEMVICGLGSGFRGCLCAVVLVV